MNSIYNRSRARRTTVESRPASWLPHAESTPHHQRSRQTATDVVTYRCIAQAYNPARMEFSKTTRGTRQR